MPYMHDSPMSDRIRVELIEADIEQAFGLVDLAEAAAGDPHSSARILQDTERVLLDMKQRLAQLAPRDAGPFTPLVAELRRSIEQARRRCA